MPITPEKARAELARRELERRGQQQPAQQSAQQPLENQFAQQQEQALGGMDTKDLLGQLMMLGGAGAAGYGVYQGAIVPAAQKGFQEATYKQNVFDTLKGLQKQLGVEGTEAEYIPKRIGEVETGLKSKFSMQENDIKYRSELALQNAKKALNDFDDKILSSNVDNLSKTLEENFPVFLKSASQGYEAGMNAIEQFLESKNIAINSQSFTQGMVDKTITEGMTRGLTEMELSPLMKIRQELSSVDKMPFSQVKGYVSGVINQNPNSKLSALLRKNWLSYLDDTLPADVSPVIKGQLTKINSAYKQFAEARFQYSKIISPAGEFNRKAANKYLLDYFKSNIDDGTEQLMNLISKGNDIVGGIQGVESQFNAIKEMKPLRTKLTQEIFVTKQLKQQALNDLADEATQKIGKLRAMRGKYDEFISRFRVIQEKEAGSKLKMIPRLIKNLHRFGKIGGTVLTIVPQLLDAYKFSQDPEAYMAATGTSFSPEEMKEMRNKYQKGTMTEEEKIALGLIL